jgi:HEXXH motif-containing protein
MDTSFPNTVAGLLDSGALDAHASARALRLRGVKHILRQLSEEADHEEATNNRAYDTLLPQTSQCAIDKGTPFFWLNVDRLCGAHLNGTRSIVREWPWYLELTAFDSFFDEIPDQAELHVHATPGKPILLPRLGAVITPKTNACIVKKSSKQSLVIQSEDEIRVMELRSGSPSSSQHRLIPGLPTHCVVACKDPALFDDDCLSKIASDCDTTNFAYHVGQALHLISEADPSSYARIIRQIWFFVPIHTPHVQTHCSFTAPALCGVVFLSDSSEPEVLAEAIVHEHGHTELNMLLETEGLFEARDGTHLFTVTLACLQQCSDQGPCLAR